MRDGQHGGIPPYLPNKATSSSHLIQQGRQGMEWHSKMVSETTGEAAHTLTSSKDSNTSRPISHMWIRHEQLLLGQATAVIW